MEEAREFAAVRNSKVTKIKEIAFLMVWTAVAASFAWLGFSRLAVARERGSFGHLRPDDWPLLLGVLKVFLIIWTGVACFMTVVGCVWLVWALMKAFR
jgi:hypothetical protein